MSGEEARVRDLVLDVLREALRVRGLEGLVLAAPPSPEGDLLIRWADGEIPLTVPSPEQVTDVARVLAGGVGGEDPVPPEPAIRAAWASMARYLAGTRRLLPVHPAHKSVLLLDAPECTCFPLGDLWGEEVAGWAGGCTLPRALADLGQRVLPEVETALRRLIIGIPHMDALVGLEPRQATVLMRAIRQGRHGQRPALVPKLSAWTPGMDPPL